LGNGTIEIVDLAQGRRTGQIKGLHEPQGVAFSPEKNILYVASGGDGSVRSYDSGTLQPLKTVTLGDDADNLRYDPNKQKLFAGYGEGAIAVLDSDLARSADFKLPAHPESFQLASGGKRIFVNLPNHKAIASIDLSKNTANALWAHPTASANFPMAIDEIGKKLFIACRQPPSLIAFMPDSGQEITHSTTVGDADDLFYDPARNTVYVIGGEGFVDIVAVHPDGSLESTMHVPTAPGARTGLFVPQWNSLLVAAPRRGTREARILVFSVGRPSSQPHPASL